MAQELCEKQGFLRAVAFIIVGTELEKLSNVRRSSSVGGGGERN